MARRVGAFASCNYMLGRVPGHQQPNWTTWVDMGLKDLKERPLFIWLEHFLRQHLRGLKIVSIKLTQDKELSIDRCFNLFPDLKRKFWELKNALGSKYLMHYLTFKRTIHFMLILDHRTMKLKCPMSIWLVHCCTYLDRALLEERYQP